MTTAQRATLGLAILSLSLAAGAASKGHDTPPETTRSAVYPNPITGEGLPNPNPHRIGSWAQRPEGRQWGSTAGIDIDPTDGIDIDPTDGHIWAYERCGAGAFSGGDVNCDNNQVDPVFKFDRETGEVLRNFGAGIFVTPHGIHVDREGNVWVTDFRGNDAGNKGHQVHKFSPSGELLMSLGVAGQPGNDAIRLNQPCDVITAPDGTIFVADGHAGQYYPPTEAAMREARAAGHTGRIVKYSPKGEYLMEWGRIGTEHGNFRTPHALALDAEGRLWVADRGNNRIQIFDQNGNYLESRYLHGRVSDLFITGDGKVYTIDSESSQSRHIGWRNGIRIGPVEQDRITAFIPPWETEKRPQSGVAGEGVAVDREGNVYVAEGPSSLPVAGAAFTKYACKP